jgi:competence protein ComEC
MKARRVASILLIFVLLLAGCVPGNARSDGSPTPDAPFTLTALDVGQGDALLLRTGEVAILVDAGEPDAGVVRALRREGVQRLDLLIVTHAHLDHVGGAPAVLDAFAVAVVWMLPVPAEVPVAPEVAALLRAAARRDIPVRGPPEGAVVAVGDLVVEVLGPPSGRPYAATRSELNNASIVVRVSKAGIGSVILAGDAEREAQSDLLARHPERLRADVLVVPHHGSRTSDPDFLTATGAHTAVISVGTRNRHGHPAREILEVLEGAGMRVLRTDRGGTIRVAVGRAPVGAAARVGGAGPG